MTETYGVYSYLQNVQSIGVCMVLFFISFPCT